jgi:hypothetical protein
VCGCLLTLVTVVLLVIGLAVLAFVGLVVVGVLTTIGSPMM